jgi:hypothetical protein
MRQVCLFLLILLAPQDARVPAQQASGVGMETRTWTKVQYFGGGVGITMNPKRLATWNNRLTISSKTIELKLEDGQCIEIDPARVTAIAYRGRKFSREELAALAVISPAAVLLPFLTPKSTEHYIGIQYQLPSGLPSGLLVRAHKDNHAAILEALRSVTKVTEVPADASVQGQEATTKKPEL